jgi:hypothetical protein
MDSHLMGKSTSMNRGKRIIGCSSTECTGKHRVCQAKNPTNVWGGTFILCAGPFKMQRLAYKLIKKPIMSIWKDCNIGEWADHKVDDADIVTNQENYSMSPSCVQQSIWVRREK